MEDVQAAGGIMTILGELLRGKPGLLHEDALTVTGRRWARRSAPTTSANTARRSAARA
jgi:dihydroxyacid dehydratase/phosphogluconate dehydratase